MTETRAIYGAPPKRRNRHPRAPFAKRVRRLHINVEQAAWWTKITYGTARNYNQGRRPAPRAVMRLLAVYRLLNWGKF